MKYTFLLPAYKGRFFDEMLRSIQGQTYTDFKVIISDDCSPEDLRSICEPYREGPCVYKNRFRPTMTGLKRQLFPFFSKRNTIVVYPEVCYANFLNARNVVRWFLSYNRFVGDFNAYGNDDLFITFRDVFNDLKLNPDKKKLLYHTLTRIYTTNTILETERKNAI